MLMLDMPTAPGHISRHTGLHLNSGRFYLKDGQYQQDSTIITLTGIFIVLASVEKYTGKYWFSGKCFVYFKDDGPKTSFYLNARRYFNDFNYLQLTLGTGTAPDEPFGIREDIDRLSANSVRLAYNFAVKGKFSVRLGAGYSREEYDESGGTAMRDRFEGNVNLIYALKMK